jgi:putative peptidoglycan lipid II flippase
MSDAAGGAVEPVTSITLSRSAVGMGAAAAVSRAFGALRMVVIAAVLGTTFLGNAFQASNTVSNVLFELLAAGALSAVLVPSFVEAFARRDVRLAEELAGGVLSLALVVLGVVTLFGVLFAPALARLLTAGVSDPAIAADQRELATFLLRFFVPQILLYALGAVGTALLQSRGRFVITAMAPIGNTLVIVASMAVFRAMAGPNPGLHLSGGERLVLALGGTVGVVAYVGVTAVAVWASGFRYRFGVRRAIRDVHVRQLLRLSGWAALQSSGVAILQGAALIAAGGLAGGVVAYQLGMVVFLAPYGILAQPIHTTVLPRLAAEVAAGDLAGMRATLRWAIDAMAAVTAPIAALLAGLSTPVMAVLAFGEASRGDGPQLLAAALGGLALGIPAYGGFLLLTRASYALGDSRTPALAALGSAVLGTIGMLVAGATLEGPGCLWGIAGAHTTAQAIGTLWLAQRLHPTVGNLGSTTVLRVMGVAATLGAGAWLVSRGVHPDGRISNLAFVTAVSVVGLGAYLAALRLLRAVPPRSPATHVPPVVLP